MKKTILSLLIIAVIVSSCTYNNSNKQTIISSTETLIDTSIGSCAYLTKDDKNNVVLSWVKQVDTTTSILCYAVSADDGKTFGNPIEISGSTNIHPHAENLPKIIFKPSGEIIALWGASSHGAKNPYAGLVFYSQSFNGGKTWSTPTKLVNDTAGYDQRYFDVALMPDGEAGIIWLDNRKKTSKDGSALYFARTAGKNGFQNETLISEPCCECCRTDLFIDSKKNIHVLYRAIINDSIRDMAHAVSVDDGKTFSAPKKISDDNWVINGCPHTGPAMAENKKGLFFSWFTAGTGTGVFLNHSFDNGNTFSSKDSLSTRTGRHPQITTLNNNDLAIVWDESIQQGKSFGSRIGLQINLEDGNSIKQYITDDAGTVTYPVITAVKEGAVVAYTKAINKRNHVFFRTVSRKG